MEPNVRLEVLHVADCPNLAAMLERLHEVADLQVTSREISTPEDAVAHGMAGSPTLLVNGVDPFAIGSPDEYGVSCRLYRDERGRMVSVPSRSQLRAAIAGEPVGDPGQVRSGEILSAWRTRALPLDSEEAAVHKGILRGFAATGGPPTAEDLKSVLSDSGRSTADVLSALHRADAIRLALDGQIAVAYPFSARPTRHQVRVAGRTDVYAMCAIDALGISPMLAVDTLISSDDGTDGQPITVATSDGRATWTPSSAVAVIGADAGGGPSAVCCCSYLNFFTDADAANAWLTRHPHVRGQVLTQHEAEQLAVRLFGNLLTSDTF
jgi:Alkylmercury lyase